MTGHLGSADRGQLTRVVTDGASPEAAPQHGDTGGGRHTEDVVPTEADRRESLEEALTCAEHHAGITGLR